MPGAQQSNLIRIGRFIVDVRGFQNLDDGRESWIVYDGAQTVQSDRAFSDVFMAVLAGAFRVFGVVDVQYGKPFETDLFIKLIEQGVKIADIVAGIVEMTRIEQTFRREESFTPSRMARISSKVQPISLPFPAMLSRAISTLVESDSKTSSSPSQTQRIPSSAPCLR